MEIAIDFKSYRPHIVGVLVVISILLLLLLGHGISPVEGGRVQVLTPERWQAIALERKAYAEIVRLVADAQILRTTASADAPNAIEAMSLAQRVYAAHRSGTAATAPARQALIVAAEAVARYAAGGMTRAAAIEAVNAALQRIQVLAPAPEDTDPDG